MNHNQFDGSAPVDMYAEPERTSIAAILSLILGILGCCTVVTSVLAIPLAVFAIIGIKGSKGRVGGMGLAIAGLILGILSLALGIGGLMAARFGYNYMDTQVITPTTEVFTNLENGDFDAARALLASPAADATDDELIAFRDAYTATLGNYSSKPTGWLDYFKRISLVGQTMNQFQPPPGTMPVPMSFDQGDAMVIPLSYQNTATGQYDPPTGIIILDMNGNEYKLPAD
jgi:hypothetical protein